MRLFHISAIATLALQVTAAIIGGSQHPFKLIEHPDAATRELLQNIVKWDNSSLLIHGERIMIFSGEFHPFRLPVPSLWLDVFQKIKALGFNTVSFYADWALLEGTPGRYTAEGIFALEPFFEAAKEAGVYLIARPGPYINAEVSGGGFPGWIQQVKGKLRSSAKDFLNATENYVANIARTVADAQITNGGPIILYQPENEYTHFCCGLNGPDGDYMQYVIDQVRNAGVVIPIISNDASPYGTNAPGTGPGAVDIYGHDGYPLGDGCDQIKVWPSFPTDYRTLHLAQSPSTPYSLNEYQAGYFDSWGGASFDNCVAQLNEEYERVYYKNLYGFGVTILNLYMIYGGTNWGNLGDPYGYTSYDYGAAISESRQITREKYSELKLQAQFLKVSPSYLTAVPGSLSTGIYSDTTDVTVTPLIGNGSFFVVRHSNATGFDSTTYKLKVPTNAGQVVLPQLGGSLSLNGRDSKIHVTDYDVAGINIQYSSAEILTWKKFDERKVLVVYGGPEETHEISISINGKASFVDGPRADVKIQAVGESVVINWKSSPQRRIIRVADLDVLILDRNSAYNYWIPEVSPLGSGPGFSSGATTANSIIIKAGYLVRGASIDRDQLHVFADFNATTAIEVIGASKNLSHLYINGELVSHQIDVYTGFWTTSVSYKAPQIKLPRFSSLQWKYIDSLPEIRAEYDDSGWTTADHKTTNNSDHPLHTPTSLYSPDYGYYSGYHLYRGHFIAAGNETSLTLHTQQGMAYGQSIWLNETYIGSWTGVSLDDNSNVTYNLPGLAEGKAYVFTILLDHMGLEENWVVGQDLMKTPRGILNYSLSNREQSAITWKLTGNLGGENYVDHVRGPLNEGGLYVERQGWHQPEPPSKNWQTVKSLNDGISKPGVGFFVTSFELDLPKAWDVPLFFSFNNGTLAKQSYRVQLYVNGYQFGKYSSNIGPQATFPVPEGILNYHGTNWVAFSLWALEEDGAHIDGFTLEHETPVMTSMRPVELVNAPAYERRPQSY